jgi:putative transcriptional regulator
MLQELLDTAEDMNTYGVMSKTDMALIRALCEVPPIYTPDRIVAIRTTIVKASQAVFATMAKKDC